MAEEEESDAIGLNIALEFSKNLEKNFLTIQKKMNLSPPHMGPWLQIQPPQLHAPHSRALITGVTPTTRMKTQFLQWIP